MADLHKKYQVQNYHYAGIFLVLTYGSIFGIYKERCKISKHSVFLRPVVGRVEGIMKIGIHAVSLLDYQNANTGDFNGSPELIVANASL